MWIKLQGIKAYTARGKVYAYDRLSNKRLQNTPRKIKGEWHGNEALVLELASLRKAQPKAGTVQAMIADYKTNDVSVGKRKSYLSLADRTRKDYDRAFDRLTRAKIGGKPIAYVLSSDITMEHCRGLRDGWNGKYGANQTRLTMAACSVLWSYGVEYSWIPSNLWLALPTPINPKTGKQANQPWTPAEFLQMVDTAPHIGLARAYALAFCGIRPESLPTVTLRELRDQISAQKTGKEHTITVPDVIAYLFEGDLTSIMATTQLNGAPWTTYSQLRRQFGHHRDTMAKAQIVRPNITLKGLNHTLGSALSETGATGKEMQAAMARSAQTVDHYSRRADKRILSEAAFSRLSGWFTLSKERRIVSNNHRK